MASEDECDAALRALAGALADVEPELRRKHVVERTVSCTASDLKVTWTAQLTDEGLVGVSRLRDGDEVQKAQVRLAMSSDDLLQLVNGTLALTTAVATGRLRVHASPLDLLRLGSFL